MLVEQGLIGLGDAVDSDISAWKNLGVYASGPPSLLADAVPGFSDNTATATDESHRNT